MLDISNKTFTTMAIAVLCLQSVQAFNATDDFEKLGEFFSIFGNFTLLVNIISHNMIWCYSDIKENIKIAVQDFNDEK